MSGILIAFYLRQIITLTASGSIHVFKRTLKEIIIMSIDHVDINWTMHAHIDIYIEHIVV